MAEEQVKKPETQEVATAKKDIDLFGGWFGHLENPDPVLRTQAGGKGIRLYDEVDRDSHASSVLQTRALAVAGCEYEVRPGADDQRGQDIADFILDALGGFNFTQAVQEWMQAVLYGFRTGEVMWSNKSGGWLPKKIIGKHPRRFSFTFERDLRLLTPENMMDGEPVPDRKFVTFTYGDSDSPYGKGLGQKLWWSVWFKKHGIKFWLTFLEKFGAPTPVGKYPANADDKARQKLLDAIDSIQNETGVIIPEGMTIDFLEATRGGNAGYKELCEYFDRQISKAVLGQTASTEGTPGKLGNEDSQEQIRQDILKADADLLAECLNETLIPWMVDFNYFGVTDYPQMWFRTEPEQDLKALAERDEIILKKIGYKAKSTYIEDTYNIPAPEDGEDYVGGVDAPKAPQAGPESKEDDEPEFAEETETDEFQRELDRMADQRVREAAPLFEAWTNQVMGFVRGAGSLQAAKDGLDSLKDSLGVDSMAARLADALMEADSLGADSIGGADFSEALWGPGTPFKEAMDYFRDKAFRIAGVASADLLDMVKAEILKAMESGSTLEQFMAVMPALFESRGYTALKPWRVNTIWRTNMQVSYQGGRYRQLTSPAIRAARPYWRYMAVLDASSRPEHAAMHGKIFRWDHPVWQTWYPPNGFNCRCTVVSVSKREIERNGWTVETEDPTNTLIEPVDPATGHTMPARYLIPDPGWGNLPFKEAA
ncbi:phage head morphogenesis protein, SPP1 gp7 family [Desulfatibacillum aliphaticivorans]|uniref:Phage head morphogenesis protein, SPP1 gp7 family n=1 Tax=Desulfatibacillum aliphaticivorans TaxID=218208 RepID=B8FC39_DESAL|nr:DUF935 family protein [Desulfatibacillum aliphaticivorans]ACL05244.1 phage head morphogenesis protein, SPP1 gp7 family [Desulfatibacillum aliphaticivorans]